MYHLDWNTLSKGDEESVDPKEKCKTTSPFPSLSPATPTFVHQQHRQEQQQTQADASYDIIIASDMVCCDSDAVGVTKTLLSFLSPHGIAFFAVPHPYHRYGIAHLIPTLKEQFHVFIRSVSHSSFAGQRHPSYLSDLLTEDLKSNLDHDRLDLLKSLLQEEDKLLLDDMLTEGLPEIEYFEWFLLIVIKKE